MSFPCIHLRKPYRLAKALLVSKQLYSFPEHFRGPAHLRSWDYFQRVSLRGPIYLGCCTKFLHSYRQIVTSYFRNSNREDCHLKQAAQISHQRFHRGTFPFLYWNWNYRERQPRWTVSKADTICHNASLFHWNNLVVVICMDAKERSATLLSVHESVTITLPISVMPSLWILHPVGIRWLLVPQYAFHYIPEYVCNHCCRFQSKSESQSTSMASISPNLRDIWWVGQPSIWLQWSF